MKMKALFVVITAFLLLACGALAGGDDTATEEPLLVEEKPTQSGDGGEMSTEIDALMAKYAKSPGGAVMVIQNGEVKFQKGYGLADVESETPITIDTIFHLGSVGKQFTALGVMILAEQGLVNYDDPIGKYIPELAWMDGGVTIRRLLYHTSGVMGYDDSDAIYNALIDSSEAPTNEDLLSVLNEQGGMLTEPGEVYSYSNTGYEILGSLIERVSGQKYAVFMDENIFVPLGMTHTFSLPNAQRLTDDNVAQSYYSDGGQPWAYEPDILDGLTGSGSIYSTLGDMYLYDQALRNFELVSAETLEEAFTSGTLNNGEAIDYGFGVELSEYSGYSYIGHSGAWLGFESYYLHIPDQDLSVVVLLNLDYSEEGAEGIAFSVADLFMQ
jgi:CubicO group peptidase (beta-lactamase class C family)